MPVYKFDALKKEYVTPRHSTAFGSLVTGEQLELGMLRYKAGEGANEHAHPHEQAGFILEGRATFFIGDEQKTLGPGDMYRAPGHVRHKVIALDAPGGDLPHRRLRRPPLAEHAREAAKHARVDPAWVETLGARPLRELAHVDAVGPARLLRHAPRAQRGIEHAEVDCPRTLR